MSEGLHAKASGDQIPAAQARLAADCEANAVAMT